MSDIFISYAREDRERAKDLAARLEREGWSVFWDRTIPVGSTWDEVLDRELSAAKTVVVLWSLSSVASEWVRSEAEEAASRRILVPAFLEQVKLPMRFRALQAADISDWTSSDPDSEGIRQVIEAISRIGGLKTRDKAHAMEIDKVEAASKRGKEDVVRAQTEARRKLQQEAARKKLAAEAQRKAEQEAGRKKGERSFVLRYFQYSHRIPRPVLVISTLVGTVALYFIASHYLGTEPADNSKTEIAQKQRQDSTQEVSNQFKNVNPRSSTKTIDTPSYNPAQELRRYYRDPVKPPMKVKPGLGTKTAVTPDTTPTPEPRRAPKREGAMSLTKFNPIEYNAEYILIPGGTYTYSVTKEQTTIAPLYFAKNLVTNKQYRRFINYLRGAAELEGTLPSTEFARILIKMLQQVQDMGQYLGIQPSEWAGKLMSIYDSDKRFNGDDQPVVGVSWYGAVAYCLWLTELSKASGEKDYASYRLPTEEEWEWAASGGTRKYPWGKEEPNEKRANYDEKRGKTTPVGSYPAGATPEGLMDMAGNVWEWMENLWEKDKPYRALRGGSWVRSTVDLRCFSRSLGSPDGWGSFAYGFRVVRAQSGF